MHLRRPRTAEGVVGYKRFERCRSSSTDAVRVAPGSSCWPPAGQADRWVRRALRAAASRPAPSCRPARWVGPAAARPRPRVTSARGVADRLAEAAGRRARWSRRREWKEEIPDARACVRNRDRGGLVRANEVCPAPTWGTYVNVRLVRGGSAPRRDAAQRCTREHVADRGRRTPPPIGLRRGGGPGRAAVLFSPVLSAARAGPVAPTEWWPTSRSCRSCRPWQPGAQQRQTPRRRSS